MDQVKAASLKSQLADVEEADRVVPLARFFDGNDDDASIGCNLSNHPGVRTFHSVLQELEDRAEVDAVYVQLAEADPGPTDWPFTDTALVVGDVATQDVRDAVARLQPDDVWPVDLPQIPGPVAARHPGRPVAAIWWD